MADSGCICISLDFSLNGIKEIHKPIYDVENFAKNTISREIEELCFFIRNINEGNVFKNTEITRIWNGEIHIIGFSLGGTIALNVASKFLNISKLALWATIARLDRYTDRQKEDWLNKGSLDFENSATGQMLRLNSEYLSDILTNHESFSPIKNISKLDIPVLIVHGSQDITVALSEATALYEASNKYQTNFEIIERTGHTFGCGHPLKNPPSAFSQALNFTKDFFIDHE
ncbi:MAG: alpha/beta hydrolase [Candidatus Kapabacteria bacterium]|nr:alpha/beta hydrolase [Candidatus Kapabacteria bacterium]